MFSKQEASRLRQEFWTTFGQYLHPVPSASGQKINWINYKTGVRYISFKMDAENASAYIGIEITHPAAEMRSLFYNYFASLKNILTKSLPGNWNWEADGYTATGQPVSRIYAVKNKLSVYRKEDWPEIISFFKTGIIAIDAFWADHREMFDMLA